MRPLLKTDIKIEWNDESHFQDIKNQLANTTENAYFNPHLETLIKCDASRAGLGTALEQRSPTSWHIIAFASCFLKSNEEMYSVNELELLVVVYSVKCFECFIFGKSFTVITDHRALISALKKHRSNES